MKKLLLLIILLIGITTFAEDWQLPEIKEHDIILLHGFYSIKYNEKYKNPDWVAYKLDASMISGDATRKNYFSKDQKLVDKGYFCPSQTNYSKSGYDKGHQLPAADMKFSQTAMDETFITTNICPQLPDFNRKTWMYLESLMRNWASTEVLYIATGPLYDSNATHKTIGKDNIAVPEYFYKVILIYNSKTQTGKAIGFILKNEYSGETFQSFARTVDYVEYMTGLNFFAALPDEIEEQIESDMDLNSWEWPDTGKTSL